MAALARCLLRVITTSWGIDFAPVYSQIPPLPHIRTSSTPTHLSIGLIIKTDFVRIEFVDFQPPLVKFCQPGEFCRRFALLEWTFVQC